MIEEPVDDLAEAEPDTEGRLKAFPNPPVASCPVVPLGYDAGYVIFALPEGEIRREPASKIKGMLRSDIFVSAAGQSFLTWWRDADDKFQAELAAVWFVRACRDAGKWDTRRAVRALGVWPGRTSGEVVLHKGDELWRYRADGVDRIAIVDALKELRGPLYRLFPPAPQPGDPASAADGLWMRAQLDLWRFEAIGDEGMTGADVLAGWLGGALLGAAAPFRGHLMLRAMYGSGKSTLMELVHAALSALTGDLINSFSDAGWRADIAGMARPIVLDEAEGASGDQGPGPVEQVLTYLRLMSTGAGAARKMGDMAGGVTNQTAVGAVIMAAILPPPIDNALASRVADINLLTLARTDLGPDDARPAMATEAAIKAAIERASAMAPALLGRALAHAGRYRSDVALIKAALVDANHTPRTADLVSMFAAGRRLLMFDAALTPETAEEEVAFWAPLLDRREVEQIATNTGADALAHLLAAESGVQRGGRRVSIGELVAQQVGQGTDHEETLKANGLRFWPGPGPDARDGPWLMVANKHVGLSRIFERSDWRDYRHALGYLDEMGPDYRSWATKKLRFGVGSESRARAIPLTPWLEESDLAAFRRRSGERSG